jgi:hypothetical protein
MKKIITALLFVNSLFVFKAEAKVYYCSSTGGKDSNPGNISQPFATIEKLWSVLAPGDTGYLRGGIYRTTKANTVTQHVVLSNKTGTSTNPIRLWAYPGEQPFVNLDNITVSAGNNKTVYIMYVQNNSWIHIKGIRAGYLQQNNLFTNQYTYGWFLDGGSNNIIEQCESDHNCEGFAINNQSNLLVLNCDAHHLQDPFSPSPYDGSNGFSSTQQGDGTTVTFRGCRAWWCCDDGWDLYSSSGTYTFDNCWAFWNGYIPGTFTSVGNGDGFKMGGGTTPATGTSIRRFVSNCVSFQNKFQGFDQNNTTVVCQLYNNTSFGNGGIGYHFSYQPSLNLPHVLRNNVSYQDANGEKSLLASAIQSNNTWNSIPATTASFASLANTGVDGVRQSNGALPNLQFLHLSATSNLINAGVVVPNIPYNGSAPDLGAFEYPVTGSLVGSGVASSATVNLTTTGTADWAHWNGYDHKSSGGGKISNYTVVGSGSVLNYNNDPRTCTWSDGTPTTSGSNINGIYITGIGKGFQITAPADLSSRTLKVYVGGYISGGTLTASLSDGSAADYVNSSFSSGSAQYDAVYTLTYKAASSNKLITVKWTQSSGSGNVTLQAAALVVNSGRVMNQDNNNLIANSNTLVSDKRLSIYPNPFADAFAVKYSGKELGHGNLYIYTTEMKLIATYAFEKTSLNVNQQFSAKGLASGIYIIEYQIGNTKIFTQQLKFR